MSLPEFQLIVTLDLAVPTVSPIKNIAQAAADKARFEGELEAIRASIKAIHPEATLTIRREVGFKRTRLADAPPVAASVDPAPVAASVDPAPEAIYADPAPGQAAE